MFNKYFARPSGFPTGCSMVSLPQERERKRRSGAISLGTEVYIHKVREVLYLSAHDQYWPLGVDSKGINYPCHSCYLLPYLAVRPCSRPSIALLLTALPLHHQKHNQSSQYNQEYHSAQNTPDNRPNILY